MPCSLSPSQADVIPLFSSPRELLRFAFNTCCSSGMQQNPLVQSLDHKEGVPLFIMSTWRENAILIRICAILENAGGKMRNQSAADVDAENRPPSFCFQQKKEGMTEVRSS